MIYDFPTGICITEVSITEANAVGSAVSPYTYRRETQDWGGEQWRMSLNFLPMSRAEASTLEAFISRLRGGVHSFRMGDPYRSLARGNAAGAVTAVVQSATPLSTTIDTSGWTASTTDQLLPNDLFQIENHLYKVLAAADSDASGNMTIEVWPRVRKAYTASTALTVSNARGLFTLASNSPTYERDRFERFETTLQCAEVL